MAEEYHVVNLKTLMLPTEQQESESLAAYLRVKGYKFTHVPNETGSDPAARRRAIRMKRAGTSKGFPDYIVIVKDQLVFIELKRSKGGRVSPEQREWLEALSKTEAHCIIARGAHEAIEYIETLI